MLLRKHTIKIFFLIGLCQYSQAAYLRYYRSSTEDYKETELEKPLPLIDWIDSSKPTFFFAFGFHSSAEADNVKNITNIFIKKNHTNYILVNWKMEARNDSLDRELAHALTATPNSIIVGRELGISLVQLSCHLDMGTVQLAGHSLGAHLVGYAGLLARKRGVTVGRITALEPSSFKYEGFVHSEGLSTSSAAFVAVWHTNPGNFGTARALGDVDIWFNCEDSVQPGCPKDGHMYKYGDKRATCSHRRALRVFAEAVCSPKSFIAVEASSCETWAINDTSDYACKKNNVLYVNENIDTSARGLYYLSTNSQPPYSKGMDGIRPR